VAEVKVTHPDLGSDDAKVPPKREPIPPGEYHAIIMAANVGTTNYQPPLIKVSVEFQVLYPSNNPEETAVRGRRVFQDFILEHDPANEELSAQRRYELRMLLDATNTPVSKEGTFNTDHLAQKAVKIVVRHRRGKPRGPDEPTPIFANVSKIDSATEASEDDML
jgi:hypothetical protein